MADKNYLIEIEYTGKFEDGTVFDSSKNHGKPLKFISGFGMIIPGLEKELVQLNVGDEKEIKVKAEEAYGPLNEATQKIPKNQFPKDLELKEGMDFMAQTNNGNLLAKIKKVNENDVDVTLNHPLAGKDLIFEVKVITKKEANTNDINEFMQQAQ